MQGSKRTFFGKCVEETNQKKSSRFPEPVGVSKFDVSRNDFLKRASRMSSFGEKLKNLEKWLISTVLTFLLISAVFPMFLINTANADKSEDVNEPEINEHYRNDTWTKIQTDLITILFPANGRKPMFLWWYANDTDNIYVVKYKGLIEYLTIDHQYYQHRYNADAEDMKEMLEEKYGVNGPFNNGMARRNFILRHSAWNLINRPSFLPFSACKWSLDGPTPVTREDGVSYISFNFTLAEAPRRFDFAENNVIIRARFYSTDATENALGAYNYTVHAGELKMDLVIKKWDWNVNKIVNLLNEFHEDFNITVPQEPAALALWVDLASINLTKLNIADEDVLSGSDIVEAHSDTSDIIVGEQRIQTRENRTALGDPESPILQRVRERYRLRFAKGSQTLAGFFDFVDNATVIDSMTGNVTLVNVTATYVSAGAHLRLFIGYPYFGDNVLEHDPTIGVEQSTPWLPTNLLFVFISVTAIVAVAVLAVRVRRKPINIVGS